MVAVVRNRFPGRGPSIVALAFAGLAKEQKRERGAARKAEKTDTALPKDGALQHGTYMAAVRTLACRRCGYKPAKGGNQFCHADQGKGLGLKTDVREGWAGCGPHSGVPGCHHEVGTSGNLPKAERRRLEKEYAASTRAEIERLGLWPRTLPKWKGKP